MKYILLYITIIIAASLNAQDVTSSSGNSGKNGSYSVSWTLGEPVVVTASSAAKSKTVTQGFQQPLVNETILPINLLSFNVVCNSGNRNIIWVTASEKENDYFLLLKSYDAKNWNILASVGGAGTSNDINKYTYTDTDIERTVYYKLKQVDYNGTENNFNTISSICGNSLNEKSISIYPNPVKGGEFTIEWYNIDNTDDVKIYNSYWQNIKTYNLSENTSNALNIKLEHLSSGIYFIVLNSETDAFYEKIIVE